MDAHFLAILIAEMVFAAAVWVAFPVHYHTTTGGAWARTAHGRNVMMLGATLALMIVFTLASVVLPESVILVAALVLWPVLALVGLHRHRLLWRDQHPGE